MGQRLDVTIDNPVCAAAWRLHERLGTSEENARCHVRRVDGKMRRGYRVTVIRLMDAMWATEFVPDQPPSAAPTRRGRA